MAATDTALRATTYRLEELLDHVRSGRIRVPRFQRTYRWSAADVLALFDSAYRGFPIGTLLFWERAADAQELVLGDGAVRFRARLALTRCSSSTASSGSPLGLSASSTSSSTDP